MLLNSLIGRENSALQSWQVLLLRNQWAHPHGVDHHPMDARDGLRDLRQLLNMIMDAYEESGGKIARPMPPSLRRAAHVTDDCIATLDDIPEDKQVDLFSMTIVFFERALARYCNACKDHIPALAHLLRDNVTPQELKVFFGVEKFRPDPLEIITTYMDRNCPATEYRELLVKGTR
jgi:hypothetical protein